MPTITAHTQRDGSATVTLDHGQSQKIKGADLADARSKVMTFAMQHAERIGETVTFIATDPDGEYRLLVRPDGSREAAPQQQAERPTSAAEPPPQPRPVLRPVNTSHEVAAKIDGQPRAVNGNPWVSGKERATAEQPHTDIPPNTHTPAPEAPEAPEAAAAPPAVQPEPDTRRAVRESRSFLAEHEEVYPTPTGLRAVLARLGLRTGPTEAERRTREQERAVSQLWPGTRTIAVLNGKGGAGKTPTTILLSALFARYGGSGVLAWDNNVTRGTLGWRTEKGPHDATMLDLLPHASELLAPGARAADLAAFVHHQTVDKFDVLRSNPLLLSTEQKITPEQLDAIHSVAAKYFRIVFMDSGNDEGDDLWVRMIDHADHLVVATTTRADHAEAARLLLDALHSRDERSSRLANSASVIVSQADREEKSAEAIAQEFAGLGPSVTTIPYDTAMRQQWLRYDALKPASRAAWLTAAANVAAAL